MVQGSFQWGSRVFERSSKGISGVGKGVSWKFQRFSKKVFRMLQGTFKGVSRKFQGRFNGVYVGFKGGYKKFNV